MCIRWRHIFFCLCFVNQLNHVRQVSFYPDTLQMSNPCPDHDSSFWTNYSLRQELGCHRKGKIGSRDLMYKKIYQAMSVTKDSIYDVTLNRGSVSGLNLNYGSNTYHGGIFNLSFSPNGSIVVAATQRKSLLIFDPLTHSLVKSVDDAHCDSVNYVRFLDEKLFATCSDDTNVALWDMRMLPNRLQLLEGHSYWVKNIEYDASKRLLLTSSYDGSVRMWDIFNTHRESPVEERMPSCPSQRLLHLSCIMRMRMTNNAKKMILCTSEGYMMVIHDLNLETIQEDLKPFQSDLYRLMQKGHSCGFDFGSWCNHLFSAKQNRVEIISDFPEEDDAHSITSLDVHPHSWSILTRNITKDDSKEWTCVHDIQDDMRPIDQVPMKLPLEPAVHRYDAPSSALTRYSVSSREQVIPSSPNAIEMHVSPVVIISSRAQNRRAHATILNPSTSYREINRDEVPLIYKNINRLTHFSPELNVGSGFIKELSFSTDGRVIASPFEFGYRILSFNNSCSEVSDCHQLQGSPPQELKEVKRLLPHSNHVAVTKFSPTTALIASGCLSGRVVFSQPVL